MAKTEKATYILVNEVFKKTKIIVKVCDEQSISILREGVMGPVAYMNLPCSPHPIPCPVKSHLYSKIRCFIMDFFHISFYLYIYYIKIFALGPEIFGTPFSFAMEASASFASPYSWLPGHLYLENDFVHQIKLGKSMPQ